MPRTAETRFRSVNRILPWALIIAGVVAMNDGFGLTPARGAVRAPILAGSWYPDDPAELRRTVERYLEGGTTWIQPPVALIVPHAGYVYSGPTAGRGFAAVRGQSFDRVFLLGPSHRASFKGAGLSDAHAWKTPLGEVALDRETISALSKEKGFEMTAAAHAREHSLEIELPFLQVALKPGFRLIPIMVGHIDAALCKEIATAISERRGERDLIVISSDFTHFGPDYGYVPFRDSVPTRLRALDEEGIGAIREMSPAKFVDFIVRTEATICGVSPIRILLTMLGGQEMRVETLGYAQSGEILGDFTNSVSYAAIALGAGRAEEAASPTAARTPDPVDAPLTEREQEYLLRIARDAILSAVRGLPAPPDVPPEEFGPYSPIRETRGVFVTLTENDRLRGCIGSILGVEPLFHAVIRQAINAATEDPRFEPVGAAEIERIHIEISVLTPPRPVEGPDEIVVGKHGVVLRKKGRQAVFLPQVATEQGWDRETMLASLCRKAGLGPDEWRSGAEFDLFEAQIFEEPRKSH